MIELLRDRSMASVILYRKSSKSIIKLSFLKGKVGCIRPVGHHSYRLFLAIITEDCRDSQGPPREMGI